MTSPQPYPVIQPRTVTPGLKNQNPLYGVPEQGMWCRPDWIRLVGPGSMASKVVQLLEQWFGESTGSCHGAKFFKNGIEWYPGVLYSQGHSSEIVMVDLQGSRLAMIEPLKALEFTEQLLMMGFHCTRIDLAVDHVNQCIGLYDKALASCVAGELCIMRRYSPDPEFDSHGTPLRKLLKLGKRDSEVCSRIYDKGLETGLLPEGEWERFEVEMKGDRAREVCMSLVLEFDNFTEQLWKIAIGSVDFRVRNGRSELKRRPRATWWSGYIGLSTPRRMKPVPRVSSLDQWCEWFRKSAGRRLLQLAEIFGQTPDEFFSQLIEGLEPANTVVPASIEAHERRLKRLS